MNGMPTTESVRASLKNIVVGTRGSALAQWQTQYVIAALNRLVSDLSVEQRVLKTAGDKDQTRPLGEIGGLGVFTKELENALLAHEIDLAVHSLKDLPTDLANGLTIAAVMEREDPRDALVSRDGLRLSELPAGARVGTSSTRRSAQVLALRPDLVIVPLRGNVDTRLRKAHSGEYDAVVLAAAGVIRLGRRDEITEYLPLEEMLPDPGQGALALEVRSGEIDEPLAALVSQLDHRTTRSAVTAERSFLRALGGGCRMPIGAFAEERGGELKLSGLVASPDGAQMVKGELSGKPADAEAIGAELAARLLHEGAGKILGILNPDANRSQTGLTSAAPLRGKRILITRAEGQAKSLAEEIRQLGGEPIEFPTIDFAPLEDFGEFDKAVSAAGDYDWIVFTSANGVRSVAERLSALGRSPSDLASTKIAAIGPATARELEGLNLHVDFIPTRFLGEQLAQELPVQSSQRALLLRADIASDALALGLTARGVAVTNVDAYRTVTPKQNNVDLAQANAVTFTSSSTVRHFVEMLGSAGPAAFAHFAVFCIGPVTAETARELGLRVDAVAAEHTMRGLVKVIVDYYSSRQCPIDLIVYV